MKIAIVSNWIIVYNELNFWRVFNKPLTPNLQPIWEHYYNLKRVIG